jgi:hypothetical protein
MPRFWYERTDRIIDRRSFKEKRGGGDCHELINISKVMPSFVSGKCNVVLVTRTTDNSTAAFVSANLEGRDIWYGAEGLCAVKCYTE